MGSYSEAGYYWDKAVFCSDMRYRNFYRSTRSVSPQAPLYCEESNFSDHVDNIINRARANSEMRNLSGSGAVSELRYASLVCSPHSPWSKTGAFYWPRYPEAWRGTASCTTPLRREYNYWASPARYYRYKSYYPSHYPRYRTRF